MNAPNGTPYYIAPEVLKGSYTTQCDTWSMGIVMFIMMSGQLVEAKCEIQEENSIN